MPSQCSVDYSIPVHNIRNSYLFLPYSSESFSREEVRLYISMIDLSGSFGGLISQKFSDAGTIVSGCLSLSQKDLKLLTPISCEHVQNESAFE